MIIQSIELIQPLPQHSEKNDYMVLVKAVRKEEVNNRYPEQVNLFYSQRNFDYENMNVGDLLNFSVSTPRQ